MNKHVLCLILYHIWWKLLPLPYLDFDQVTPLCSTSRHVPKRNSSPVPRDRGVPKGASGCNQRLVKGHLASISHKLYGSITILGVSENSGTPKSSILIGFSIINHPFWGTTIFGKHHMQSFKETDLRTYFFWQCLSDVLLQFDTKIAIFWKK